MAARNVLNALDADVWKVYKKKYVPFRVRVFDTDFFVIVCRRGKKKVQMLFHCLNQYYAYTLDDDKINDVDVVFEYQWFYEYCKSIYEIYFENVTSF